MAPNRRYGCHCMSSLPPSSPPPPLPPLSLARPWSSPSWLGPSGLGLSWSFDDLAVVSVMNCPYPYVARYVLIVGDGIGVAERQLVMVTSALRRSTVAVIVETGDDQRTATT
jgi:hypothetical protein